MQFSLKKNEARLITDASNIRYLSGFTGSNGQILITRDSMRLLTDFRYWGEAKKVLPGHIRLLKSKKSYLEDLLKILKKKKLDTLYFEEQSVTYSTYRLIKKGLPGIAVKPQKGFVEEQRMVKNPAEIAKIIRAQRIAEKVFTKVRSGLKTGQKELEVAWEIIRLSHEYGADDVSFPPIVAFGKNSGTPHHLSGARRLKKGDIVLIDMGVKYRGYCSDMTRMIFTATPSPLQRKVYLTVLEAQEKAIKAIKEGVTGVQTDAIARKYITKAGYGKEFGHSLGHGVGLQIHELPSLSTHYSGTLPKDAVVTVEPGIYMKDSFGVRIEDMVLVSRKNAVNLTKIPKGIEDCIVNLK